MEVHKRQNADTAEMALQCALERFDAIYEGNNSRLVAECRSVALLQEGLDPNDGQAYINTRFRSICTPGCGNVLLDVYDECGAVISPHERSLMANICGFNQNGAYCYEFLLETRLLLAIAARCPIDRPPFYDALTCNCSAVAKGVETQGCCYSDISNNFINLWKAIGFVGDLDLDTAYADCEIKNVPSGCDNSPLTASGSLPQASHISAVAIILSLLSKLL